MDVVKSAAAERGQNVRIRLGTHQAQSKIDEEIIDLEFHDWNA